MSGRRSPIVIRIPWTAKKACQTKQDTHAYQLEPALRIIATSSTARGDRLSTSPALTSLPSPIRISAVKAALFRRLKRMPPLISRIGIQRPPTIRSMTIE